MKLPHKPSCKRDFGKTDQSCPGCNPKLALQTRPREAPSDRPKPWSEIQRYLTPDEAAEYLNIPWLSFLNLARANVFATFDWSSRPAGSHGYVRLEHSIRFDRANLDAWAAARQLPPAVVPARVDADTGIDAHVVMGLTRQRLLDSTDERLDTLTLAQAERDHIVRVMDSVNGSKRIAERILGISRLVLNNKLARYGLDETFWTIRLGSGPR